MDCLEQRDTTQYLSSTNKHQPISFKCAVRNHQQDLKRQRALEKKRKIDRNKQTGIPV